MSSEPPLPRLCCLDLDTFFVSVERLLNPDLVGKPVVVGAMPGNRGVVTACSYEVREFGVRSGMGIREAVRLAPHAIFLPGTHGSYSPYAKKVKAILERYTPVVQTASIDEFFLDFAHCEGMYRTAGDIDDDAAIERTVHRMRQDIQDELGLPASAGIGASRSVAKIASGRAKPAGVCMVRIGQEWDFAAGLPVRKMPGIGPVMESKLRAAGIDTLGQLMSLPPGKLRHRFGRLSMSVRGRIFAEQRQRLGCDRPAFREHDPQGLTVGSISNERTFSADVHDTAKIEAQLRALAERVCWRARSRDILGRTVHLRLRYSDFHTITRSRSGVPTNTDRDVFRIALDMMRTARTRDLPIRLLGVGLSNLQKPKKQVEMSFALPTPTPGHAIDDIRQKFGYDAIRLGVSKPMKSRWLA